MVLPPLSYTLSQYLITSLLLLLFFKDHQILMDLHIFEDHFFLLLQFNMLYNDKCLFASSSSCI